MTIGAEGGDTKCGETPSSGLFISEEGSSASPQVSWSAETERESWPPAPVACSLVCSSATGGTAATSGAGCPFSPCSCPIVSSESGMSGGSQTLFRAVAQPWPTSVSAFWEDSQLASGGQSWCSPSAQSTRCNGKSGASSKNFWL